MTYRIQQINDALLRECLAERTHIYVDWPAVARGEFIGEIQFDNAWYLVDSKTGQIIAKDSSPAPALRVSLVEAMDYGMVLPKPTEFVGGMHVNAILRAMHAEKVEAVLAPPVQQVSEPAP